jgi:hypothetical protein
MRPANRSVFDWIRECLHFPFCGIEGVFVLANERRDFTKDCFFEIAEMGSR